MIVELILIKKWGGAFSVEGIVYVNVWRYEV